MHIQADVEGRTAGRGRGSRCLSGRLVCPWLGGDHPHRADPRLGNQPLKLGSLTSGLRCANSAPICTRIDVESYRSLRNPAGSGLWKWLILIQCTENQYIKMERAKGFEIFRTHQPIPIKNGDFPHKHGGYSPSAFWPVRSELRSKRRIFVMQCHADPVAGAAAGGLFVGLLRGTAMTGVATLFSSSELKR